VTGADPGRYGNAHPSIVPYQPFRAADGFLAVAAANDGLYRRLCDAVDRPELAADERYATNEAQRPQPGIARRRAGAVFASRPTEDWGAAAALVRCARRQDPRRRRGLAHGGRDGSARHRRGCSSDCGTVELVRAAVLVRPRFAPPSGAPPLLGQHTAEVLDELGVDAERLSALEHSGVIAQARPA